MKLCTVLSLCLVLVLMGLTGCKSEREKSASATIDVFEDMVSQLEGIKSNADLVDTKPKLEKIGARLKDQMKKMQDMGRPGAEEDKALDAKYKPRMEKVMARLQDQMTRLQKDLGGEASMAVLQAMNLSPMDMMGGTMHGSKPQSPMGMPN